MARTCSRRRSLTAGRDWSSSSTPTILILQCFSLMMLVHRKRNKPSLKRTYAHHVGFGVRLGQQKIVGNVLHWKCLCAKEGFRPEKGTFVVDPSKKGRNVKLTICGYR
uniref:Uncharacterized protein n=1 Tax=Triticum urartu TaxID=4572 RepID=A0A8R7U0F7_TRIUA